MEPKNQENNGIVSKRTIYKGIRIPYVTYLQLMEIKKKRNMINFTTIVNRALAEYIAKEKIKYDSN